MADVVVVSSGEAEAEEEPQEEIAEEVEEALHDVAMDATTISLVERVTRIEDTLLIQAAAIEQMSEQVGALTMTDQVQQQEIEQTQEAVADVAEAHAEVAAGAADAIQEVAQDVEQASPEIEPDEIPTVRKHWFFRKWGGER